jgi:hypothetical protein
MLIWITLLLLGEGAGEASPTPDVDASGFSRRRTATYIRRNADFANRSA